MRDEDLITAIRFARGLGREKGWRCAREETLAAYAEARLPNDTAARLQKHLADCGYCRRQVSFLLRHEGEEAALVPQRLLALATALGSQPQRALPSPGWRWAAATATAAVVVLAVSLRFQQEPPGFPLAVPALTESPSRAPGPSPAPATAASEKPHTVRGAPVVAPLPELFYPGENRIVLREKLEFRWKAVPGALWYELRVTTASGELVLEHRTERTSWQPSGPVQFPAGQKHFAWVVAHVSEGRTAKSRAVSFQVAP